MNKQLLIKSVLAFSLSAALPGQGMAATQSGPLEFDSNGDGTVSSAEIQAGLSALFTKIDTNGDKYLSLAEVSAWRESEQVTRFTTLDTDANGKLSIAELQATSAQPRGPETMTQKLFNLLDADKSGDLSSSEFALLEPGKGELIRHFASMDSNDDLQISEAEFVTAPAPGQQGPGGAHPGGR